MSYLGEDDLILIGNPDLYALTLKGYEIEMSIGIHDFEQRAPQRIRIAITLFVKRVADTGDRIETVVDYDFLRQEIAALVRSRHFNLQEVLCEAIADLCMVPDGVKAAIVATEKPDVYPDAEAVGCKVVRRRM